MKLYKLISVFLLSIIILGYYQSFSQLPGNKMTKEEYIELYKEIAIEEMHTFGIPASITLSQGILESASGNSELAKTANNHFGIKCHKGWAGKTFHMDDDKKNECFRRYKNPYNSFKDHSKFLSSRDRYASLFDLEITDYKAWAYGLKKAGYATNPKYPQLLINIIEEFELNKYDKLYDKNLANRHRPKVKKEVRDRKRSSPDEDFKPVAIGAANRQMYTNNGIKLIYARKGDTFYKIAQDFNIYTWQVRQYNDLKKNDKINEGQVIYIEAKKKKGNKAYHTVSAGETLYDISQKYGIKLKKLCKNNTLKKSATLYPDQQIKLR